MQLFYAPQIEEHPVMGEVESKHIVKVLRKSVGDEVIVTDGVGGLFHCQIELADPKKCTLKVVSKSQEDVPFPNLEIAIAPTKSMDRFEWFIEKAVEIGVQNIVPLVCRHSERKTVKLERLEKIAHAASKQSLKYHFPKVEELERFDDFVKSCQSDQKFIAYIDEEAAFQTLQEVLLAGKDATVLIGPEGDFNPSEVALAKSNGFIPISLGKSRLRTETAGIVACHTFALMNDRKL